MAITVKKSNRIFKIVKNKKEIILEDPNPKMTISEVSEFYSNKYPELMNSIYDKKEVDGDLVINFKSIAGTKG